MRQPARKRTLVHLVNLSGHSQTGYFQPIAMHDIEVSLADGFRKAHSVQLGEDLRVAGRTFTLPILNAYDAIVVE